MALLQNIFDNLPRGGAQSIAARLKCSASQVHNVLTGNRQSQTELTRQIIAVAQILAAVNVWNKQYPLGELKLDPFKLARERFNPSNISDELDLKQRVINLEAKVNSLKLI